MATYTGDGGDNSYTGTDNADQISGGGGNDTLAGGGGGDTIDGDDGNDVLFSGSLSPNWQSPNAIPVLDVGTEIDVLRGLAGNDTLFAGYGDFIDGGADLDSLFISFRGASSGVTANFAALVAGGTLTIGGGIIKNIEMVLWVEGSTFADDITMSDGWPSAKVYLLGGDDHLVATGGMGEAYGGDGNDTIDVLANSYSSPVYGEAGNDTITGIRGFAYGGIGNDTMSGGGRLFGEDGNDTLTGIWMGSSVYIYGGLGDDGLTGSEVTDYLSGGEGADTINGGGGSDTIYSATLPEATGDSFDHGSEYDVIDGGAGDDTVIIGYGDAADGGDGIDTLVLTLDGAPGGVTLSLNIAGSGVGGAGNIVNFEKLDVLSGTAFADTITVGAFDGRVMISGGDGGDTLTATTTSVYLLGGRGDDILTGSAVADAIQAGNDNDTLFGGGGNDSMDGEVGDDTLEGGLGDDTLRGGEGNDTAVYAHASGAVTVNMDRALPHVLGADGFDTLEFIENVIGSAFDDQMTGDFWANMLEGGNGADTIYGKDGNDRLFGSGGNDTVNGQADNDLVDGGTGTDTLLGEAGNDTIYGAADADLIDGGAGDDRLYGDALSAGGVAAAGNDSLFGGAGADFLYGDDGADILWSGARDQAGGQGLDDNGLERDQLFGGGGDDELAIGYGDDADGGAGSDKLRISLLGAATGVTLTTAGFTPGGVWALNGGTVQNAEILTRITGSAFGDTITVATHGFAVNVDGGDGADLIHSSASAVLAAGGNGNDRFVSSAVGDRFDGGAGIDTVDYSQRAAGVTVQLGLTAGAVGTGPGGNQLIDVENIDGSAFADLLVGSNDANVLDGREGADELRGGLGNDTYYVDGLGDLIVEGTGEGFDAVYASANYVLAANAEVEWLSTVSTTATTAIHLTGSAIGQYLVGNAGNNLLDGAGGADVMIGYGGNDSYYLDNAADVVVEAFGGGNDAIYTSVGYYLSAGIEAETLAVANAAGFADINLTGNEFHQALLGNAGFNQLDGGGGADVMTGYGGSDSYIVNEAGDVVVEADGQGFDALYSSIHYTLAAGVSVEWFTTINNFATDNLNLTGNEFGQYLVGNAGGNTLNGGGGADLMYGLGGDDTYIVDNAGDVPVEGANGGNDRVRTSVSYLLSAGIQVERIETVDASSTAPISLIGNELNQDLYGNIGNNALNGAGGADRMYGLAGNDTYYVDNAADLTIENFGQGFDSILTEVSYVLGEGLEIEWLSAASVGSTGALNLTGNEIAQYVLGNDGANIIDGGRGSDTLYGYGGADMFRFTTGPGSNNVDTITDFVAGTDRIALDDAVFGAIGPVGALAASAFVTGAVALDADDRIIYNSATGQLFYDADGSGVGAAVLFANLQGNPALAASDFQVI